jgi:hypothetical protein
MITNINEYRERKNEEQYEDFKEINVEAALKNRYGIQDENKLLDHYNQVEGEKYDNFLNTTIANAEKNVNTLIKMGDFHF